MIVGHRTRLSPNVHICDLMVCLGVPLKTLKRLAFTKPDSFKLRESDIWIKERGDLYELRNLATKWYMLIVIKKSLNATLFGKTKLNETPLNRFSISTHFGNV